MKEKTDEEVGYIMDTVFQLFKQYGFRSVTMDELAAQLGMSKKTLYIYFADKNDLVKSVIERRINEIQAECIERKEKAANAIEELFLSMEFLNQLFRNMNPIMMSEMQRFHIKAYHLFEEHKNDFLINIIKANLERGIREGLYRTEIDTDIIAHYRMESCMLCFKPDIFPQEKFIMVQVQQELLKHYLYGIVTRKGYDLVQKYEQANIDNN